MLNRRRDEADSRTSHDARDGMTDYREFIDGSLAGSFGILYTGGRKSDDGGIGEEVLM